MVSNPFKILLVGDCSSGKTSYCQALARLASSHRLTKTANNATIVSMQMTIDNLGNAPIEILDSTFSLHNPIKPDKFIRELDALMIIFDVTNPQSYDHVLDWKKHFDNLIDTDNVPCLLLANKCDQEDNPYVVAVMKSIENFCQVLGFLACVRISTVTGENIDESIQMLLWRIIKNPPRNRASTSDGESRSASIRALPNPARTTLHQHREISLKFIVIGDRGVGKTTILERYTKGTFNPIYIATTGVDSQLKIIKYDAFTTIRLFLWDIAGEEWTCNMTHVFYKNAVGCLVVFDQTKESTLTRGAVKWKLDVDRKLNSLDEREIPCVLLGNKCDLNTQSPSAHTASVQAFCTKYKFLRYFSTSAKKNINVSESIKFLLDHIMKTNPQDLQRSVASGVIRIEDSTVEKKPSESCCLLSST